MFSLICGNLTPIYIYIYFIQICAKKMASDQIFWLLCSHISTCTSRTTTHLHVITFYIILIKRDQGSVNFWQKWKYRPNFPMNRPSNLQDLIFMCSYLCQGKLDKSYIFFGHYRFYLKKKTHTLRSLMKVDSAPSGQNETFTNKTSIIHQEWKRPRWKGPMK